MDDREAADAEQTGLTLMGRRRRGRRRGRPRFLLPGRMDLDRTLLQRRRAVLGRTGAAIVVAAARVAVPPRLPTAFDFVRRRGWRSRCRRRRRFGRFRGGAFFARPGLGQVALSALSMLRNHHFGQPLRTHYLCVSGAVCNPLSLADRRFRLAFLQMSNSVIDHAQIYAALP